MSTNYEQLSDEDFLNLPLESEEEEVTEELEESNDTDTTEDESVEEEEVASDDEESEDEEEENGEPEEDEPDTDETEDDDSEDEEVESNASNQEVFDSPGSDTTEPVSDKDSDNVDEIDYKAEYEKILAPFRANGKDMQLDSVDDAIKLMKMGAGFNKKMHEFKPFRKTVKMLQNNDLLDEGKLSFLIDLHKKDPAAITKLIKDSNINPLDLDLEETTEYKPNTYSVDDREIVLDDIVSEIKDSSTYERTIDIVSTKWDDSSRQVLFSEPAIIKVIDSQVADGTYDKIIAEVDKSKMLGNLTGLSDLEAYKVTGEMLLRKGVIGNDKPPAAVKRKPVTPKAPDPKVTKRKRKVAPVKSTKTAAKTQQNYASMSDEQFLSLMDESLL